MIPSVANDPAVRAARLLHDARKPRIRFRDRLQLVVPFPIGCYLVVKALLLGAPATADPIHSMIVGTIRGIEATVGFFCFFVSLRAYFRIRGAQKVVG